MSIDLFKVVNKNIVTATPGYLSDLEMLNFMYPIFLVGLQTEVHYILISDASLN